jgi:hypothetical protein
MHSVKGWIQTHLLVKQADLRFLILLVKIGLGLRYCIITLLLHTGFSTFLNLYLCFRVWLCHPTEVPPLF